MNAKTSYATLTLTFMNLGDAPDDERKSRAEVLR